MSSLLMHPVWPFVLAAVLVPVAGALGRRLLAVAAPLVALWLLLLLPDGASGSLSMLGHEWVLLRMDGLSRIFALAFILYAGIAAIYAWDDGHGTSKAASLALSGAGVGVVLAGDLLSLFLFWEWLTVASLFLIWLGGTDGARAAGLRYLAFHLLGATVMLIGILMRVNEGRPGFEALGTEDMSSWLILLGMLTNAAVPPLHAWLADAYPRASVFGTVFLAAFTTKAAVYALARAFPGAEPLVWGGTAMALFGVVYAVLENDIRRLLAYHIISQVGYMVAGVGLGSALALNGASAHAFSHIFYKGLLMMSAGAVIHATGRRKLTELGQLAGPLRWALVFMMIGAFSISGVPLFNGFVSKSMVVSAAAYADRGAIELLLLLASMGTFLHTGLKLPWFTFFGSGQGARVQRPVPVSMYVAMGLAAVVCTVTGVLPDATLYTWLPFDATYQPFTAHHTIEALQLLIGTALGFWILRGMLGGEATITRDVDLLYRAPVRWLVEGGGDAVVRGGRRLADLTAHVVATGWMVMQLYQRRVGTPTLAVQMFVILAAITIVAAIVAI